MRTVGSMTLRRNRAVIASTHVDGHGERMSKEALEQMAQSINDKHIKIRMGVDHRRDFPPMGWIENAALIERDDHYYLEADYVTFEKSEDVSWGKNLRIEYSDSEFQFKEVESEEVLTMSVSVDPHNFHSFDEAQQFAKEVKTKAEVDVSIHYHGRKSLIPDPEVIFELAKSFLIYHLLKPTAKKIGEEIADKISKASIKEGEKATAFVLKTLKEVFRRCIPKSQPVVVVFDFPGKPHVDLIARTRDEKLILKGLSKKRINEMQRQVNDLSGHVSVAKIQFLLDSKGRWQFNYLITDKGATIGTKIGFAKRDRKFQLMSSERTHKKRKGNSG